MIGSNENAPPQINKLKENRLAAPQMAAVVSKGGRTIEQMYQKKTQLEHILLRPDTYVGSIERQTQQMWVFDTESGGMVYRPCTFVSICENEAISNLKIYIS